MSGAKEGQRTSGKPAGRREGKREGRAGVVREHSKHETAAALLRHSWHKGRKYLLYCSVLKEENQRNKS